MTERSWPFLSGRNIEIVRADGIWLYTSTGQRIMDAAGGAIVANIGHGRARVADAVYRATLDYTYVVPPWLTPSRQALVDALDGWLPPELTRIHITSGGSEANEAAMKMAVQYQAAIGQRERTQVIARDLSYHGTTLATTSASGHPGRRRGLEGALTAYPKSPTPYPLRCPLGPDHPDAGRFYVDALRECILQAGPETVAALLAEPITGSSGGAIVPPEDYWPGVRKLCDEFGILLILDEVMTGFGRTVSTSPINIGSTSVFCQISSSAAKVSLVVMHHWVVYLRPNESGKRCRTPVFPSCSTRLVLILQPVRQALKY